eukprot:CAMPEP_0183328396 /NCGR_PEP_ID=MMETSP0160_2-20130417/84258_1 /TAXON_ID=2839 ORGANISM="Odontella Sinensis, Strain Grunow 1884" /NCGR_SAMPLE_ID=MMETSP0160_2 /ASSEMBLY_ACC=CAM_ASM_000250 /LENGTH=383 /DNA_ID=CAMNT_0025496555 /DNA_START=106 /DNA_END=1257 /DNA_ORIENTATION=-
MPSRSVASQRGSVSSKNTKSSMSVKKMGSKIIGRVKGGRKSKDKKKAAKGATGVPATVPETVSTDSFKNGQAPTGLVRKDSRDDVVGMSEGDGDLIHVILFLMNPNTRKFEILLLDFEIARARVRDVLAQIPVAAKEESFKTQRFSRVADVDGCELIDSHRLSRYASDWAVMVAIPDGMTSNECVELARPILGDPRVKTLLEQHKMEKTSDQADVDGSPEVSAETKDAPVEQVERELKPVATAERSVSRPIILFVLLCGVLGLSHKWMTAPLEPGHTLAPGKWRNTCGLLAFLPKSILQYADLKCGSIRMGTDGILTVRSGTNVIGKMQGGICMEDDETCVPGVSVREDGTILIGGKGASVLKKPESSIAPWPFSQDPLIHGN